MFVWYVFTYLPVKGVCFELHFRKSLKPLVYCGSKSDLALFQLNVEVLRLMTYENFMIKINISRKYVYF